MLKQGRIYRTSVNILALVLTSDVYGWRARLIHRALIILTLASLLVILPHHAQAQTDDNITTVGSLELVSTFRSVSIYSNFSGDINGNNTAMLQYQKAGETVWRTGPQLVKDMRPSLTFRQGVITNPFYRQWRGSLMFLEPDTGYEVRVTYTDRDGINGSGLVQSAIRTMDENIPAATGSSYYVATDGVDSPGRGSPSRPWATIQYAADQAQAGGYGLHQSRNLL